MRPWFAGGPALTALVLCLLAAPACRMVGAPSQAAAEDFLDAHYVHINLPAALSLASGLAADKISREMALTDEVDVAADTLKPRINYRLEHTYEKEDGVRYSYRLSIRAPGLEPYAKRVILALSPGEEGWRVANFSESELPTSGP